MQPTYHHDAHLTALGTVGFVTDNEGTVAPGNFPLFEEIACPYCKKKLSMGHENVIVIHQTGDDSIKLFIHYICLKSMMADLEKEMVAKRG